VRKKFLNATLIFLSVLATPIAIVTQPFVFTVTTTPAAVSAENLKAHVKYLSVDVHPRSADNFSNLQRAADYIFTELKTASSDVSYQEVLVDGRKYQNIIARFGFDHKAPTSDNLIVIGAHYDSHGHDDPIPSRSSHTPGADDNASGVAGIIELAKLLRQYPPSRPIELVAYTLEEPPFFRSEDMGSAHHVRSLVAQKRKVDLMISLEMIGYFSDSPASQDYPVPGMSALYSDAGNFITVVGKLSDFGATRKVKALMRGVSDLPVYSINAPPLLAGIDFSDHLNYWAHDMPALMITDTAFLRNKQYHLQGDTYDRLDYVKMAQVVRGVYAVVTAY
jgi:Zn-dependent M28 family amino/carboxypeptidase